MENGKALGVNIQPVAGQVAKGLRRGAGWKSQRKAPGTLRGPGGVWSA